MKVGEVVKLKNPKNKREAKRRWRVVSLKVDGFIGLRRLDTVRRDLCEYPTLILTPISLWEKLWRRVR